jgi:hypothetical protein
MALVAISPRRRIRTTNAIRANVMGRVHVRRPRRNRPMVRHVSRPRNALRAFVPTACVAIAGVWGVVRPARRRKRVKAAMARAATYGMTRIPTENAGLDRAMAQALAGYTMAMRARRRRNVCLGVAPMGSAVATLA